MLGKKRKWAFQSWNGVLYHDHNKLPDTRLVLYHMDTSGNTKGLVERYSHFKHNTIYIRLQSALRNLKHFLILTCFAKLVSFKSWDAETNHLSYCSFSKMEVMFNWGFACHKFYAIARCDIRIKNTPYQKKPSSQLETAIETSQLISE